MFKTLGKVPESGANILLASRRFWSYENAECQLRSIVLVLAIDIATVRVTARATGTVTGAVTITVTVAAAATEAETGIFASLKYLKQLNCEDLALHKDIINLLQQ